MNQEDTLKETMQAKLTFGDLKVGDHFIAFPLPGDNDGHGGYLVAHHLFQKVYPLESGVALNGRGVLSSFPASMPIIKVITK